MRRVATGELPERLRKCATDELTENPERRLSRFGRLAASGVKGFGANLGGGAVQRTKRRWSHFPTGGLRQREVAETA